MNKNKRGFRTVKPFLFPYVRHSPHILFFSFTLSKSACNCLQSPSAKYSSTDVIANLDSKYVRLRTCQCQFVMYD